MNPVHGRLIVAGVMVALAGGCSKPAPETPEAVPRYSIEEFMSTVRIGGASFSPDGRRLLFTSNATGVFNIYEVPVDGGTPLPLTRSEDDGVFSIGYFPQDERLLYSSDRGGNELTHVYVRELDGTVIDLTPGDGLRATFAGWAGDDRSFFVSTNERDPRFMDIYEYAVDGYTRTELYRNEDGFLPGPVSGNRRYVALTRAHTTSHSDVHLLDRWTGRTTHITPHTGAVSNRPLTFTPDDTGLLLLTDRGHEFAWLARYDLSSGAIDEVLKTDWDVTGAAFSNGGRYLSVTINHDARTELRVFEVATLQVVALPLAPDANVTEVLFSPDERRLAVVVNDSRTPGDLFVTEIGGTPKRLTDSLHPAIDRRHLVTAGVVRFTSPDGVEIPGILYRPHGVSAEHRAPAVVMVHGGPGGQARLGYNAIAQFLANHGYVVYDINNRGSSGYGKTFFAMDDRRHGEADLADVVASRQMLIDTGYVDPARIGIMGGSYGGFMVLAALAFQPDVFDAGVNLFGVSNWVRTLQSIPPWWGARRDALYAELGDPAIDEERLRRISPLFHADQIRRPLLVLQGANDPRVLQIESDEIVAAVRQNGVPVEYIVFPDEGHGFNRRENEIRAYGAVLEFLNTHLRGAGVAATH